MKKLLLPTGNASKYQPLPAVAVAWLFVEFVASQVTAGVATECWIFK